MEDRGPPLREVREIAWEDCGFEAGIRCVPDEVLRADANERNGPTRAPVLTDAAQCLPGSPEGRSMVGTETDQVHDVGERAMLRRDQIGKYDLPIGRKQVPPSPDPPPQLSRRHVLGHTVHEGIRSKAPPVRRVCRGGSAGVAERSQNRTFWMSDVARLVAERMLGDGSPPRHLGYERSEEGDYGAETAAEVEDPFILTHAHLLDEGAYIEGRLRSVQGRELEPIEVGEPFVPHTALPSQARGYGSPPLRDGLMS